MRLFCCSRWSSVQFARCAVNPPFLWPNPTQPISWLTQPNPTRPITTNNGAYSLVVTYFYTQDLSRTFSQPSVNLFMLFTDHYTGWPKKRPELSHGVKQQSRWNVSTEKDICNQQTSSNMSMNCYLKRFHISRDTSEIVLRVIKQCLQAFYHHRNRFSKKLMVSAGVSWNGKTNFFFIDP